MMHTLILIHVSTGTVGLLSGTIALFVRKGLSWHRVAGNVFFVSMLIMAALGSYVALYKPAMLSFLNGILTCYLVTTSWVTVRRKEGTVGRFDYAVFLIGLATGVALVFFGMEAAASETGLKDGFPAGAYFFSGAIQLLAVFLDARMFLKGGILGAHGIFGVWGLPCSSPQVLCFLDSRRYSLNHLAESSSAPSRLFW